MTFERRLDADVLARAVRLVLDAEPVLGCSLKERLLGGEWERCADLDASVPFSVVVTGDTDRNCADFHAEGFEAGGPRLAVRLLRSPYGDDLCLKVDHLVADGRAAKELTCLLAEVYTRLLADPSYVPQPNLAPRPTFEDLWAALTAEQRDAATRGATRMATPRWRMALVRGTGSGFDVGTLTVFPTGLAAIKDYGRDRGATVNDMLVTGLLRSLARRFPPAEGIPLAATITADVRRFAEDVRFQRACNLSSPHTIEIGQEAGDTFDDTLQRVIGAMRAWKDGLCGAATLCGPNLPHPVMRALLSAFGRYAGRRGMVPPCVMNIGILDETRMAFGAARPVAAHILGPVPKGPGFAATVSTYRDTLTVWMGFHEEDLDPRLVECALRGMDEELRAVAWEGQAGFEREGLAAVEAPSDRAKRGGWAATRPLHG